ncbi:regulating synaptic membrane exocytosis protein [Holotrichia oblita]|uniref:Regulating synaptic membrane exocytosis protein n=1 Tax=Holotrichia oblita TaxID=644536 RepID=A0ACB9TYM7_HOLOL|nr:regulating synaptic membrane exocytosis protein [Holotrichia oblita]
MDRTGDVVELLVEHATDFRMCDLLDEPPPPASLSRKPSDAAIAALHVEPDGDKTPSSPTRRKLPKTPIYKDPKPVYIFFTSQRGRFSANIKFERKKFQKETYQQFPKFQEQMARERMVTGRVQIQVWYNDERKELVVAVLAGDDLAPRDDSLGFGPLPEAYARICLMPMKSEQHCLQTEVAPPSQNPIWNANLSFPGVPGTSRRTDFGNQRSISDDVDSIGECASLLHPDHAWGSRRGSSQSEQLEVEVYQLGKDFSRSLPGSRRSSFQSPQEQSQEELPAIPPPPATPEIGEEAVAPECCEIPTRF